MEALIIESHLLQILYIFGVMGEHFSPKKNNPHLYYYKHKSFA